MNYPKAIGGLLCATFIFFSTLCCAAQPNQADVEAKVKTQYDALNQKLHHPALPTSDSETLSQIREQAQLALMNSELSRQNQDRWLIIISILVALCGIGFPLIYIRSQRDRLEAIIANAESLTQIVEDCAEMAKSNAETTHANKIASDDRLKELEKNVAISNQIRPDKQINTDETKAINSVAKDEDASLIDRLRAKALIAQNEGKWDEAISLWRSLLLFSDDSDGDAYFGLGYAYAQLPNYEKAAECFKQVTILCPDSAAAFCNWGIAIRNLAGTKNNTEAENLYIQSFEKFKKASMIEPCSAMIFYNWGNAIGDAIIFKANAGTKADELFDLLFEKYNRAAELDSQDAEIFGSWGDFLSIFAQTKSGNEADNLYNMAFEKYKRATDLDRKDATTFFNWASSLESMAKTKTFPETIKLITLACEKYSTATELNTMYAEAFHNWGIALSNIAKNKSSDEADHLYNLAYDKYRRAIELGYTDTRIFSNYSASLLLHAATKEGPEANLLLDQASALLLRSEEIKPGSCAYNLACLKARLNDTEACRQWLETAKTSGTLPKGGKSHLETDGDLDSVRDLPWFKEFLAGLS